MKHMEVIQRTWRSVRVRKKVKLFSSLPIDIWKIIVTQIRSPSLGGSLSNSPTSIIMNVGTSAAATPSSIMREMMETMNDDYSYYKDHAELLFSKIMVKRMQKFKSIREDLPFIAAAIWIILKYEFDQIPETAISMGRLLFRFDTQYSLMLGESCLDIYTYTQSILCAEIEIMRQIDWNVMHIIEPYKTWLQRRLRSVQ